MNTRIALLGSIGFSPIFVIPAWDEIGSA